MMRVRLKSNASPIFVLAFLQTPGARRQILAASKDAINQSSINQGDVKAISLPLPPIDLQEDFVARREALERTRTEQHAAAAELDALFASLQQRAFRGEL